MALDPTKLSADILTILRDGFKVTALPAGPEKDEAEKIYQDMSSRLAEVIHLYVLSADVSTTSTAPVTMADGSKVPVVSTGKLA